MTEKVITSVSVGSKKDVDIAVDAAKKVRERNIDWYIYPADHSFRHSRLHGDYIVQDLCEERCFTSSLT